jgi:nucleoside-diphosphate-sugar epimerase
VKIAITGASGQVGTQLRERLGGAAGVELVSLGRDEDWGAAIAAADAVVHLAGTLQPRRGESYEQANVEPTRTVAAAALQGGLGRIVFLSYVGAATDSSNAYLRSKAEAEALLLASGVPTTIFRCLHVFGPPEHPGPTAGAFLAKGGRALIVPGSGRQRIAPLYLGDVVSAVANAATDPAAPTGVFDLGGPEEMSMDEFVQALNGGAAKLRHLPAPLARIAARLSPALTPALIDLLLRDNVTADPAGVAARFGFEPTPLRAVWPSLP